MGIFFYNRHYFFLTVVQYNLTTRLTTCYSIIFSIIGPKKQLYSTDDVGIMSD